MVNEKFRDIPGYEGYKAGNMGHIKGKDGNIRKTTINNRGYEVLTVFVNHKKKKVTVHRLIAMAWCDGYEDGYDVDHINYDRTDNRAKNLRWISHKDNIKHSADRMRVPRNAKTGATGEKYITYEKNRYRVRIRRYNTYYNKTFGTIEEAIRYRNEVA